MKKTKFAAVLSLCMVPAMFWSSESQAVPSWARKYNVSCYMCHSIMPGRNAVGEAFKNNGYRFPGAQEAAFTKQKNIKMGTDEWSKEFPNAPVAGSYPQFSPLSVVIQSTFLTYTGATNKAGVETKKSKTVINALDNGLILFYAGTLGDNLAVLGDVGSFGAPTKTDGTATTLNAPGNNIRVVWQFSPGFNLAIGNNYSQIQGFNGTGTGNITSVSGVMPGVMSYAELNFTRGETAGYSIVAGTSTGAKTGAATFSDVSGSVSNTIDDIVYLRGKVKLYGAGLLSGANGELGNSYNGVDNQVTLGAGVIRGRSTAGTAVPIGFSGNYLGETAVYGADIQGIHNDILAGAAVSKDNDLGYTNYKVEVGSFIYPWLFAKVGYTDISVPGADRHKPTIVPTVVGTIGPNATLQATYTYNTKGLSSGANIPNTFALALRAGF
jgi:hypothetical protein